MQIDEAREFIKFLHGAVPWNGTWFGEYAPGEKGAYWWRKHLDEAIAALIAAPAAPQQAEPVGYFVNDESDDQWHQVDYEQRNGADTYPLYLHPPAAEVQRLAVDLNRLRVAAQAVTAAVYDRERLFAVTELRATLAALGGGE